MGEKEAKSIREKARQVLAYREEMANKVLDVLEGHTCSEARFILERALENVNNRATVQLNDHIKRLMPYFTGKKTWGIEKEPVAAGSEG